MTGNLYLDLAISLAGVAFLVLVSFLLGGWRTARLDADAAIKRAQLDEPDFVPADWIIGSDMRVAAGVGETEAVFVRVLGDSLATRRFLRSGIDAWRDDDVVFAASGDPGVPAFALKAPTPAEAEAWLSRLRGEG